jgi:Zn-dependent peptidase ImmA (M78 family)/DNA-binding XRE family transcriptional regulator
MIFRGERVKQARELKGWTQSALAKAVGVSQAAIAQIEAGAFIASDDLIESIAARTHQPVRFFYLDPAPEFPVGSLLFRAHASMSKKDLAMTHRQAQRAYELWDQLQQGLRSIPIKIPRLQMDATEAAREARRTFGIPADAPIPHLLNVLEWNGVVALIIPEMHGRDAFSLWFHDRPLMALSRGRSGDRGRMNVAHELGHLILHGGRSRLEVDDTEADDFAAEFLMPETSLRKEIAPPVTLASLAALKPRWKVSIQALTVRAKELGIITERQYRYLFEQISAMGWRKVEPVPIAVEKPRALRQMAEMKYGSPIDFTRLANDAVIDSGTLRELMDDYAPKTTTEPTSKVVSFRKRG